MEKNNRNIRLILVFLFLSGRHARKSDNNLVQKIEKSPFETPPNTSTQVEITSSGRRRIRPMKYNDFADIKPKSASNENLVLRHPQPELETPVKESRRRRGAREVTDTGSPIKDPSEMKRTRYYASATKMEMDERPSKRKMSLNEDEADVTVSKKQRRMRESTDLTTHIRQRRGRSITSNAPDVKEDIPIQLEKSHKRRRTTAVHSIDDRNSLENIQIKEEPCTSQPEITRFGKFMSSVEKPRRESRSTTTQSAIKSEEIEAPPRRGRRPKQKIVVESDTQSESTDAGRKFPTIRPQRMSYRNETTYQSERRASKNLGSQELLNSPLTGASTEPSGDECLKLADKKTGRRHSRRSRGPSTNDQDIMQPPIVTGNVHSDDDIDSIVEEEPIQSRKTKTVLADIFTKAAGKRTKRKRSSPIMQSKGQGHGHGHRTSNRIAAAAAIAKRQQSPSSEHSAGTSTPHHSHGATSSDDQQMSSKKQMTLPEMMQMQKAKNSAAEQRYVHFNRNKILKN